MTSRRPARAPQPPMSDGHHAAITWQLVHLSLGGQPSRPELEAPLPDPDQPVRRSLRRNQSSTRSRRNRR